jgi:UPF0042 nucleotide-binding protein
MRLIIVSGLSGSGKTVALHVLEDLGFYCIDNMPAALLDTLISRVVETGDDIYDRLAIGVDARNPESDVAELPQLVRNLRKNGAQCEVLFLQADDEILLKRYSETRRKHPLGDKDLSLQEAIEREREVLGPIIDAADIIIDTTRTNVYELRDTVRERVGDRRTPTLSILIQSFGFKHGVPSDVDFVFDLRCLPNPYWEPHLRQQTGKDEDVIAFLDEKEDVQAMYTDILEFLKTWIPQYVDFNRSYLTIALGCTGGQHRSVYVAEKLAAELGNKFPNVLTRHSELISGK